MQMSIFALEIFSRLFAAICLEFLTTNESMYTMGKKCSQRFCEKSYYRGTKRLKIFYPETTLHFCFDLPLVKRVSNERNVEDTTTMAFRAVQGARSA